MDHSVAFSQDVHKLLQKKQTESSSGSGCFEEVAWNRDGSVVWFWNPADGNSHLPQDLGVWGVRVLVENDRKGETW